MHENISDKVGRDKIRNGYCEDVTCLAQLGVKGSPYRQAVELASMPALDMYSMLVFARASIPTVKRNPLFG